jgi:NAD(P)-dependent dehydrogenase (short-subunit alcohol dehydrogenase family)
MARLDGKVVLVSGSTTGIGEGIARQASAEGARVMIHGTNEAEAQRVVGDLGPERTAYSLGNLTDPAVPARVVAETVARFGRLDALVNNAAISTRSNLRDTTPEFFDHIMAINARAPMLFAQAALAPFESQRDGVIVNIGSINAYGGAEKLLAYSMTKGALMALTRNLASHYVALGIRSHQLNIGWTLTPNEYELVKSDGETDGWPERVDPKIIPLGRMLLPQDIAYAVCYLISPEAQMLNGAVFDVDQNNLHGRLWI